MNWCADKRATRSPAADTTKNELFHEIDDRAGYYVGGQVRYLDRAALNVLHYDNRADPTAFRAALRDFAWETKFDAAALRVETGNGWTVIAHTLAARYDDFEVDFGAPTNPGNEKGHAWTVAYSYDKGEHWRFVLEWLRVRSNVAARPVLLGEPALATETKVEVSARYALSGTL